MTSVADDEKAEKYEVTSSSEQCAMRSNKHGPPRFKIKNIIKSRETLDIDL